MPLWIHLKPILVGKGHEREKIKIIVPFRSYPTRNSKFTKKLAKILKKYRYGFILSQNKFGTDEKEGN